jgi:ribosomal-protein-alanine N-acetyltransferase
VYEPIEAQFRGVATSASMPGRFSASAQLPDGQVLISGGYGGTLESEAILELSMTIPTLTTTRLVLRPFTSEDAEAIQLLAGDRAVASTTLTIPHPYEDGAAEAWMASHAANWDARESLSLAITTETDGLVGAISLDLDAAHRRAELGYWIGVPFWNRGYATEAARAIVDFGFDEIELNRIEAQYLTRNPASARVLEKLGMQLEGVQRQYTVKWGVPEDVGLYSLLRSDP